MFLGITFDPALSFAAYITKIKSIAQSRTAILKILVSHHWKLPKSTLVKLYFALIRSITDYSAFTAHVISNSQMTRLQRIQNAALKAIFRPALKTNLIRLGRQHNVCPIAARLAMLHSNYIYSALSHRNPTIQQLTSEYLNRFASLAESQSTPLTNEKPYLFEITLRKRWIPR